MSDSSTPSEAPVAEEPSQALVVATPSPEQEAPAEQVEEEPRVRIEQWASGRERISIGQMELLMAFAQNEESAGHVLALASVFEQKFQDYCNAPVIG